ncbi:lipopolysaccharide biosynthesis protein [Hymenobacter jeollabukensis]|uniref:Lipopolysaccharide biosynthesis protein n=1 Tax=Hymenobacter jeollabukensis TaxID=2025313 RepID=A0A5R8WXK0_9BACT|nr:lipopolysaccharide biosynthesis protein [Hymenobacter jeollabukensis]TLM97099.1 lipopolysaccharide biosynthesis protein [Hymenobacter jeollabukensis]
MAPSPTTAPVDETQSLTKAAVHGVKWTTAATLTTSVLQVGYTAVMARLLSPEAFGLVALAGILLRFGSYFAQMGMEQAIIQKAELTQRDVRAAFTSSVGLSVVFGGLLLLLAPVGGHLLEQPAVVPVVRALSGGLMLVGLYSTAISLLRRQMRFRTLATVEVTAFLVGYAGVGIVLAWRGYGVWSLVGAQLAQAAVLMVLAYAATRHSIRPLFDWATYRPLVHYGGWSSVISFCEYMTGELDKLSISRLWGAAAVGLYSRAWMLIGLPIYTLSSSVARVALPSFSQVQHDRPRLRAAYLRSLVLIGSVIPPICLGAAAAAPEVVRVMLGAKWLEAVPVFRLVCGVFALSMMNMFAATVADATATLSRKFWLTLAHAGALLGLFWLLRGFGLLGVAAGVLLGEVLRTVFYVLLMRRVLDVAPLRVLACYGPAVVLSAGVGLSIAAVAWLGLQAQWPLALRFAAELGAGAVSLAGLALLLPLRELHTEVARHLGHLEVPGTAGLQSWLRRHELTVEARVSDSTASVLVP